MPHVVLRGTADLDEIGRRFRPFMAEFDGGLVRFIEAYRSLADGKLLVETYIHEGPIRQRLGLELRRRVSGEIVIGLAVTRAWNDWLYEGWYSPYPERIIPLGITATLILLAVPVAAFAARHAAGQSADPDDTGKLWVDGEALTLKVGGTFAGVYTVAVAILMGALGVLSLLRREPSACCGPPCRST